MSRSADYDRAHPEAKMVRDAKRRAKEKGLEFSLTAEDVVIPKVCPLLQIPLRKGGPSRDDSPSLDRKDSSRGYTPDNVWVVSWKANRLKNNATIEELEQLAFSLRAYNLRGLKSQP